MVKLNKVEQKEGTNDPKWLHEFSDIFPEDLTDLPPRRDIDHEIELIPGSEPVCWEATLLSRVKSGNAKEQIPNPPN